MCPGCDVSMRAIPHELHADQMSGHVDTWVGEGVQSLENLAAEIGPHHGPGLVTGHVAEHGGSGGPVSSHPGGDSSQKAQMSRKEAWL